MRASLRRAARSSLLLRRSGRRPALRRVWLIIPRMVAISPRALTAVTVAAAEGFVAASAAVAGAATARATTTVAAVAIDLLMPY
jgi:hypothetical protein